MRLPISQKILLIILSFSMSVIISLIIIPLFLTFIFLIISKVLPAGMIDDMFIATAATVWTPIIIVLSTVISGILISIFLIKK